MTTRTTTSIAGLLALLCFAVAWYLRAGDDPARPISRRPEIPVIERRAVPAMPPVPAVVAAIRAPAGSEPEKRRAMLDALASSGPDRGAAWVRGADARFQAWRRALPDDLPGLAEVETARCYAGGCAAEVRFPSRSAFLDAQRAFRRIVDAEPSGGRVQTPGDEQPSGEVLSTWIFLAPGPV